MKTENSQTETIQLVEDTRQAIQRLRSALIELFGSIDANPASPQDVARRCGLNKNLTWKLSRVISAQDDFACLNHLPGQQGLHLAIEAFEKAGASQDVLDRARAAVELFGANLAEHADDRDHLELTLESMGLFERETATESGRELAYRGNGMIWGVQVRTRLALTFLGPSREGPDLADSVVVLGFVRFRRLRANARWRLFSRGLTDDTGEKPKFLYKHEVLDPGADPNHGSVLREFCSPNAPKLEVEYGGSPGMEFYLPGGQVGNKATFDIYRGDIVRNLPMTKSPGNEVGFYASSITLPTQDLIFDVIVHRDLEVPVPTVRAYGFPQGGPDNPSIQVPANEVHMVERVQELVGSPPALATPLVPQISRIADRIYTQMGWDRSKFVGYRLHAKYPPLSTRIVMQWPLREPKA